MSTSRPSLAPAATASCTSRPPPMSRRSHRRVPCSSTTSTRSSSPGWSRCSSRPAFKGTKVVVSRGVRTLTAEEEHPVSGRQLPAAIDQHAWLDPRNGVIYVRNIAEALARLDPANAADYRARAAAYTKQIQALDDWARKEMAGVPAGKRRALASHDSLQYHRQCLRHHVAGGERLDQQERALGRGTGEAGAADPGRTREGAVSRQHHRSARHAAHRRRNRRGDRRHALWRFALAGRWRGGQLHQDAAPRRGHR